MGCLGWFRVKANHDSQKWDRKRLGAVQCIPQQLLVVEVLGKDHPEVLCHVFVFFFRGTLQMTLDICVSSVFFHFANEVGVCVFGMSDYSYVICRYYIYIYIISRPNYHWKVSAVQENRKKIPHFPPMHPSAYSTSDLKGLHNLALACTVTSRKVGNSICRPGRCGCR